MRVKVRWRLQSGSSKEVLAQDVTRGHGAVERPNARTKPIGVSLGVRDHEGQQWCRRLVETLLVLEVSSAVGNDAAARLDRRHAITERDGSDRDREVCVARE